ncbi:hypothetical protein ACJX0J_031070, partial [Zea mays]
MQHMIISGTFTLLYSSNHTISDDEASKSDKDGKKDSYQARASWVGVPVFAFLSKRGVGLTKPHANDMFLILIELEGRGGESFEVQERWGGTLLVIWQEYETS